MMTHNSREDASQKLALAISVGFHVLLLLGAYYLPFKQSAGVSSGYSITLHTTWNHRAQSPENITSTPPRPCQTANDLPKAQEQQAANPIQEAAAKTTIPDKTALVPQAAPTKEARTEKIASPVKDLSEASQTINQETTIVENIDERSLYHVHQGKQTGASLELLGWIWDTTPQPQDHTDEIGKVVFQITIDEYGEVIAIKTLEKTISPLVENIYKDALTELTFSKTVDNIVYATTSTGKVTFMLQAK